VARKSCGNWDSESSRRVSDIGALEQAGCGGAQIAMKPPQSSSILNANGRQLDQGRARLKTPAGSRLLGSASTSINPRVGCHAHGSAWACDAGHAHPKLWDRPVIGALTPRGVALCLPPARAGGMRTPFSRLSPRMGAALLASAECRPRSGASVIHAEPDPRAYATWLKEFRPSRGFGEHFRVLFSEKLGYWLRPRWGEGQLLGITGRSHRSAWACLTLQAQRAEIL